jgi:thiamine biosynthesis protein ThiI
MTRYLIKIGEMSLKGGNRPYFEKTLKLNIKSRLPRGSRMSGRFGRFFLETDAPADQVRSALSATFGITWFVEVLSVRKDMEEIEAAALRIASRAAEERGARTFKVEAKRLDKGFPLRSYDIACALGNAVIGANPGLRVDVSRPDFLISVEIREEEAILYGPEERGPGGLPLGTAGRGLLLLSGGIDSPVAGWLTAKRGLGLEGIYFHAYPFTSDDALEKVRTLSNILSRYTGVFTLHVVSFTQVQIHIQEKAPEKERTLLLRACMVVAAAQLAKNRGIQVLITGESLSQVASQTVESIRYTNSYSPLPVFRPCIGLDKEEIIAIARKIGTFETSILPYDDCCALFSPAHPLIRPDFQRMRESFDRLGITETLESAVAQSRDEVFSSLIG